jgi:hypothetical protein
MIIKVGEYIKFYYEKGYPLTKVGSSSRAFFKEDALEAVAILERFRVPIYGGFILTLKKERLDYVANSWDIDYRDYDDHEEFLKECYELAYKYINMYNDSKKCRYLFDPVIPFGIQEPPKDD